jgi:hypothetical protein
MGLVPQLSVSYESGSENLPFSFGWSLSVPVITRKTDKGLVQYRHAEESDVHVLSGADELVPVLQPAGTRFKDEATAPGYVIHRYRPRIEGLSARIEGWTNIATGEIKWRSISRDNVTTLYRKVNNSRIFDPADSTTLHPTRFFSWLLCESSDENGNPMVYEHAAENNENVDRNQPNERRRVCSANRYLKRIKDGNRVSRLIQPDFAQIPWLFEVIFEDDEGRYEAVTLDPSHLEAEQHRFVRVSSSLGQPWAVRPEPLSSHRAAFEVHTHRRCHCVLMLHHTPNLDTGDKRYDGLVRSTELDYAVFDYEQALALQDELAYQGSTVLRLLFVLSRQSGYVRNDTKAVVMCNGTEYATYFKSSLLPLEFEYSKASVQESVLELDAESLEDLPVGLDGTTFQWIDSHGESISGILTEQDDAWFYKRSLRPLAVSDNSSERETLHVMDDKHCSALSETRTLEIDSRCGSTTCQAVRSTAEMTSRIDMRARDPMKRAECTPRTDDITRRGRAWISCEPIGVREEVNAFSYVGEDPSRLTFQTTSYSLSGRLLI